MKTQINPSSSGKQKLCLQNFLIQDHSSLLQVAKMDSINTLFIVVFFVLALIMSIIYYMTRTIQFVWIALLVNAIPLSWFFAAIMLLFCLDSLGHSPPTGPSNRNLTRATLQMATPTEKRPILTIRQISPPLNHTISRSGKAAGHCRHYCGLRIRRSANCLIKITILGD